MVLCLAQQQERVFIRAITTEISQIFAIALVSGESSTRNAPIHLRQTQFNVELR